MNRNPQQSPEVPQAPTQNPHPSGSVEACQGDDPFDLQNLRLNQSFTSTYQTQKLITTVPCRKPSKQAFIRTRPGDDWRLETAILKDEVNNEMYLVAQGLHTELVDEISPYILFTSITRQGDLFLWPVRTPNDENRASTWHESALRAAIAAESNWVRVAANMNAQLYDTHVASGNLPEPEWPDMQFQELIRICFHDRFIEDQNHPLLRSLRGEL